MLVEKSQNFINGTFPKANNSQIMVKSCHFLLLATIFHTFTPKFPCSCSACVSLSSWAIHSSTSPNVFRGTLILSLTSPTAGKAYAKILARGDFAESSFSHSNLSNASQFTWEPCNPASTDPSFSGSISVKLSLCSILYPEACIGSRELESHS